MEYKKCNRNIGPGGTCLPGTLRQEAKVLYYYLIEAEEICGSPNWKLDAILQDSFVIG